MGAKDLKILVAIFGGILEMPAMMHLLRIQVENSLLVSAQKRRAIRNRIFLRNTIKRNKGG
tara:strand:- start:280 stop:462 length:183 start_codon:yes stop_codon:yes gene_type:complete